MANLNNIKNWFKTGLKPTQSQFWSVFDSFWHKSEDIPVSKIDSLQNLLDEKADAEVVSSHIEDANAHQSIFSAIWDALSGKSDANHNHNLNDLAEKSYNSLDDKPIIKTPKFIDDPVTPSDAYFDGNAKVTKKLTVVETLKAGKNIAIPFIEVTQSRYMNIPLTNMASMGMYSSKGNIYLKTGADGHPKDGKSGFAGSIPRNILGIGVDATTNANSNFDFNDYFNKDLFGLTSLIRINYSYGQKLVDKGVLNAHPDMYAGTLFTSMGSLYYEAKHQWYFDQKGQIFTRGFGSYGDPTWKKVLMTNTETWQTPTLLNGWVNFGSGYQNLRYKKTLNGFVEIEGMVKSGSSANANIFQLPVGYRPLANVMDANITASGSGRLQVYSNGYVKFESGGSTSWSFVKIRFSID